MGRCDRRNLHLTGAGGDSEGLSCSELLRADIYDVIVSGQMFIDIQLVYI